MYATASVRIIPSMTRDVGRTFARYLDEHPAEAAKLHSSVHRMIKQYKLADIAIDSVAKQLGDMGERIYAAIKATYIPPEFFTRLEQQMQAVCPANWPRPTPDMTRIREIIETDGIPIVHIPRAEIVQKIVDADDYDSRLQVINTHSSGIADDCEVALQPDFHVSLSAQVPLARRAIDTYKAGYFEAAQALSVSVCDTYLNYLFRKQSYAQMVEQVAIDKSDDASVGYAFNVHYALTPAVSFLVKWFPGDTGEPPTKLSRHRSIHNASVDHMTKLNATIAIMLMTGMSVAIHYGAQRASRNGE